MSGRFRRSFGVRCTQGPFKQDGLSACRGVWRGETARTANPAQTTAFFGVKKGFRGEGVEVMNANRIANWVAIAAIVFGVVTVLTGGRALFGSLESRADFGNVVPFVLWFNFLAGFVYLVAGAGLLLCRRWAVYTSMFVAVSTILVFVAFGVHVIGGGAFERRTIGALTIRTLFWIAVTMVSIRAVKRTTNWGP